MIVDFLLANPHVLFPLDLLHPRELVTQCMRLCVLFLFHKLFKYVLVLQYLRRRSEGIGKLGVEGLPLLQNALTLNFFKLDKVLLTALSQLLFMTVPIVVKLNDVCLTLLQQVVHLLFV